LIDVIEPTDISFNVSKFIIAARSAIHDILSRNKVPILVGGTHQYIEGLLVSNLYITNTDQQVVEDLNSAEKINPLALSDLLEIINKDPTGIEIIYERVKYDRPEHLLHLLEEIPRDQLYKLIERIDPARAAKLHPNDYRKIIRSMHVRNCN